MNTLIYTLSIGTLLTSLAACVLACCHKKEHAAGLFLGSWLTALALFVANGVAAQALPFGNMRHVLAFFPLVMVPAAWYLRRYRAMELTGWLAAASAIALVGALCMPLQAAWRQMPALQSPWFAPHVIAYVVSYGLMTVAALLVLASFRCESRLRAADAVVKLALPFMTFGLWSGAIWADAAWGGYWAWDIKEAWSLLTWCIYLIYLHVERYASFSGWRRPLLLLGFAAVLVTFFVVNLLPAIQSIHSYAR
jgi:ABC-type transport system involved in cytochrome c biogenesis permease subunit